LLVLGHRPNVRAGELALQFVDRELVVMQTHYRRIESLLTYPQAIVGISVYGADNSAALARIREWREPVSIEPPQPSTPGPGPEDAGSILEHRPDVIVPQASLGSVMPD